MDSYEYRVLSEVIDINIINDKKKGRIHSFSIEKLGSSYLKMFFSKINLPQYAYVEFQYGEGFIQREIFHNNCDITITIPDEKVNIRVILSKVFNSDEEPFFELKTVEYDANLRSIIGQDERRPYMCYAGTEIAVHGLSSAAAKIGGWGTCSLIGNKNNVLTNQHVVASDPNLVSGEIWFNWFNQSCDPSSPINEPVRLKPGSVLKMGSSNDNDYVLFTLDDFDYVNSNVKTLFGGLKINKNNLYKGETIYIPQYGNDGLRCMYISDMKNGENAKILNIENNGNKIIYNADTQGGSSGSPIISKESNQVIGLHWGGGGGFNIGASANKLNTELGYLINDSNIPVIGLGKVSSFNLELTPISEFENLIPIDLGKKSGILPFDTIKVIDHDTYSLIEANAIDLITNKIFPLSLKACLIKDEHQTNIHDDNINGNVFLKLYDFDIEVNTVIKTWVTLNVSDYIHNVQNYVIRLVIDNYDPYEIPFEISSAVTLNLKLKINNSNSVSFIINNDDTYGFVVLYKDEGPMQLVGSGNGYSEVKTLLKNASGDEILVNFRAQRYTACSAHTMNSAVSCASSNKYSKLILNYHPEDNDNLVLSNGIYEGIIPLQAKKWNSTSFENILVKVLLEA